MSLYKETNAFTREDKRVCLIPCIWCVLYLPRLPPSSLTQSVPLLFHLSQMSFKPTSQPFTMSPRGPGTAGPKHLVPVAPLPWAPRMRPRHGRSCSCFRSASWSALQLVKTRLRRWVNGDFAGLWSEAPDAIWSLSSRRGQSSSSSLSNIGRAKQAVQDGQFSKVIKALTSKGLATLISDVTLEMLSKHPQGPPPFLPTGPVPSPAELHESTILKEVKFFPGGSAPRPSGLCPSHLKEALGCPSPDWANFVMGSLTRFVNLAAFEQSPSFIRPHLCGATLFPCWRKSGGLIPIVVGEVLHRLTSKCLANHVRNSATSALRLAPLQLRVSVCGDCKVIIHATSHLMSSSPPTSNGLS